jgi:hypothetical protein
VIPPKSLFVTFDDFSANGQPPRGHQENNWQPECHPQSHSDAIFADARGKAVQMQNASSKTMTGYTINSTLVDVAVAQIAAIEFLMS